MVLIGVTRKQWYVWEKKYIAIFVEYKYCNNYLFCHIWIKHILFVQNISISDWAQIMTSYQPLDLMSINNFWLMQTFLFPLTILKSKELNYVITQLCKNPINVWTWKNIYIQKISIAFQYLWIYIISKMRINYVAIEFIHRPLLSIQHMCFFK